MMAARILLVLLTLLTGAVAVRAETPKRVVTVGGAVTEMVYALGAEDRIAGCDTTSYFPAAAEKLPKVGYMRALSAEGILSLGPDMLIVTEDAGPPAVLRQIAAAGVPLLHLKSGRSIADVRENIRVLAKAIGREAQASALLAAMDRDAAALAREVAGTGAPPRVLFILQHGGGAPLVAGAGTAADSIIRLSGAENAVTGYSGYKPLTPEAAVALKPDAILITDQGLRQAGGKEALLRVPGLALTPAARNGSVHAMDSLLLLGFGPRTAQAALTLNRMYRLQ